MPPHPLTSFEIQKYENEPKFNALYVNAENVTYFDSFGVEHIPKEIRKIIGNKNFKINIYRIQAFDSITFGYFCIGFIDSC